MQSVPPSVFDAILLLGPTGSGKTPLGDHLQLHGLWQRRCHHFDFGANLRAIAAQRDGGAFSREEIAFVQDVLQRGVLLEASSFRLAEKVLAEFIATRDVRAGDRLVLNGLPRHSEQAQALAPRVHVNTVIELRCDAATALARIRRNTGGDRQGREDDELAAGKLAVYEQRTRPLIGYYRAAGARVVSVAIQVETRAEDIARLLGSQVG